MQVPSILQGESLKRLLQGAAVGAVATIFVGFSWGGWSLGSTADKMAKEQSERAVVAALAPVCADKFRALPDAEAKTIALSKVEAWKRGEEFPKDFVTLPGETYPSSALVYACSTLLLAPKSAALQWEARWRTLLGDPVTINDLPNFVMRAVYLSLAAAIVVFVGMLLLTIHP
jgi:hypothetical protein